MPTSAQLLPMLSLLSQDKTVKKASDVDFYQELIHSLPITERAETLAELESSATVRRAQLLCEELSGNQMIGLNLAESRTLFLAALRNLNLGKMTVAELATRHIVDSAIRTLYTNPMMYLVYRFLDENNEMTNTTLIHAATNLSGMPNWVRRYGYKTIVAPKGITLEELPHRMQKPLMQRFFNFSDSEWEKFCADMATAPVSEQYFYVLNAPEAGCWSSIIARVQKVLKCMRVLDWLVKTDGGFHTETIMPVPSFTMFQAAINAKAHTLGRKPVELIPTYGYIEPERYAALKRVGKLAFALYMPEKSFSRSYKNTSGRFRTSIDGHPSETAFAGAIHDVYHAMREMAMSENVAKARMRLADIARAHPKNRLHSDSRPVDDILIDGELIHTYPPHIDTMFDPEQRPARAEAFGDIFYAGHVRYALHPNLKWSFIRDMVVNKAFWEREFHIGRVDLRAPDQAIYDEIAADLIKAETLLSEHPTTPSLPAPESRSNYNTVGIAAAVGVAAVIAIGFLAASRFRGTPSLSGSSPSLALR